MSTLSESLPTDRQQSVSAIPIAHHHSSFGHRFSSFFFPLSRPIHILTLVWEYGLSSALMSENNGALLVPCPKRTITASSKLVDPQNTADPLPSHKHAIELKQAAVLAHKQLGDVVNSLPDPSLSRDRLALSTPPSMAASTPEWQTNTNHSISATDEASSDGEGGDYEPTGRSK